MAGLLSLALSYSDKEYTIAYTPELLSKNKVAESLKNGSVSLSWGGTSIDKENQFIPIRIGTYRGLMSHRILLIREGEQSTFDNINTLADLKKIKFGQGRKWQDTKILDAAELNLVTANKKRNLFYMLDGERFDAFPRGASEAITELSSVPELPLTVEKNLVIIYPLPTYFFVSKKYPRLAKDLELGLEAMLKDGKFDEYFYSSPEIQKTLNIANLKNRRAIRLPNPFLPKETPLDRKELWLDLTSSN